MFMTFISFYITFCFYYVRRKCFGPCIRHGRNHQWGDADIELAWWRRIVRFRSRWYRLHSKPVEAGNCYDRYPTQSTTTTTTTTTTAAPKDGYRRRRERFRGIGGGDQARGVQPRPAGFHHYTGGRRGGRDHRLG